MVLGLGDGTRQVIDLACCALLTKGQRHERR